VIVAKLTLQFNGYRDYKCELTAGGATDEAVLTNDAGSRTETISLVLLHSSPSTPVTASVSCPDNSGGFIDDVYDVRLMGMKVNYLG
jgi:hypothetical protein